MTLEKKVVVTALICSGVITLLTQISYADLEDTVIISTVGTIDQAINVNSEIKTLGDAVNVTGDAGISIDSVTCRPVSQNEFCAKYPPGTAGCPRNINMINVKKETTVGGSAGINVVGPADNDSSVKIQGMLY